MGRSTIAKALVATVLAVLVCGCATFGKGPTDEELIAGRIEGMKAAFLAKDVDKIMDGYSEDYEGEMAGSKEEMREFIAGAIDQGMLDDVEIDTSEAETKIDGNTATVGPVELSTDAGSLAFEYEMKKEADGVWRVVSTYQY
jgi:ketosteroid isomerase-like protein